MTIHNGRFVCVVALALSACSTARPPLPGDMAEEYLQQEQQPVTRAEAADLLVRGLDLPQHVRCDSGAEETSDFALPSGASEAAPPILPRDAVGGEHFTSVAYTACIRLRGLEVRPDGRFEPKRAVTRAEWALAICDVLDRLGVSPAAGDEGAPNSFADLPAEHFACGAAKRVTRLGIFAARQDGRFDPTGTVKRVDAVHSVIRVRSLVSPQ